MLENLHLNGKVVVITGGGTGLGLEMVRALARSGANLAIAGRRPGPIADARDEAIAAGRDAIAIPTDVASSSDANALIDAAVAHFGKVGRANQQRRHGCRERPQAHLGHHR